MPLGGTLHARLRDAGHPRGAVVGGVELELQTTSTDYPSTILESGTIQLPQGVLAVQGVQSEDTPSAPLAITGATGRYLTHQGTVTIGDDGTLTIRLTRR
ncbi:hypothetical protein [uncultured Jatrophihabitans sp.]|uniref:hypothetical protein n=1 Tax=uncultured Jatrophihabitans sp. TaxID=1610747 RepID=UPI0035C97758